MQVYRQRSLALAAGNRAAWDASVADPASEAGRRQLTQYDNLRALGITELTVGHVAPAPHVSDFTVVLQLGHRIPGFDRASRVAARTVTLAPGPDGWTVAQDQSATDQLQVWDLPGLRVQRSTTALVAGNVDADVLAQRLADANAGQVQARRVLTVSVPAVVVVPRTAQEAARQLGRESLGQVAASTDGATRRAAPAGAKPGDAGALPEEAKADASTEEADVAAPSGSTGSAGTDRVVLNPDAFARLTDEGRRVVVTHELVHVAARAELPGQVPLWLSEGMAEYVAWEPVRMPVQTAAARLLAQVRSAGAPGTVPTDGDFDPARADVATAYQAAWLAVRHLAVTYGDERLLRFYRAVAAASAPRPPQQPASVPRQGAAPQEQHLQATGQSVERAFVDAFGTSFEHFVHQWQAHLVQLAR